MKLKRFLVLILTLLFAVSALTFVGCGASENVSGDIESTELADTTDNYRRYLSRTFNSRIDAADVQGYNNWYYYCGTPESGTLEKMCFNAASGKWCSAYSQLYKFTYIWGNWLPDGATSQGIGMSFMAPATGTMTITVKLKLLADPNYNSPHGVNFKTTNYAGSSTYSKLCRSITANEGNKVITLQDTAVKLSKGTEIMFMLYARGSDNDDCWTNVEISVNYTGAF